MVVDVNVGRPEVFLQVLLVVVVVWSGLWADGEELVGSTGRRLLVLFCFYVTGAWSHFNDNGLFIGLHPKTNEQASKHAN